MRTFTHGKEIELNSPGQLMPSSEPPAYNAIRPHLQSFFLTTDVDKPSKSNIRLYEATTHLRFSDMEFETSEEFGSHLSSTPKPRTRIVSICCQSAIHPLGITEEGMQKLMSTYDIDQAFLDRAASFGDKPRISDAGHGEMAVKKREDGSVDMHYRLPYPESYKVSVTGPADFTKRQVCVFHRYSPSNTENLWIFLHSRPNTKLDESLRKFLSAGPENAARDWFSLHLLVFNTYVRNWRHFLRNLGEGIEEAADIALTMDLSDVRHMSEIENINQLLRPQYLGSYLLPLSSELFVTLQTIRRMADVNALIHANNLSPQEQSGRLEDTISYYTMQLEGYIKSVRVLESRVQNISNLLATAFTLNNQARMLQLTDESAEDNANVFVVTMVTLVYLPASFVSTLLGMNLFAFDEENHKDFIISRKFWVFFAAAVPLTCLTMAFWYFLTRHRRQKRRQFRRTS